jgi:tetratricopeptide (TPR) repeat protein
MRKLIIPILLVLTFLSSMGNAESITVSQTMQGLTAMEWFDKAYALWDGNKFTSPKKAIEYLSNAINLKPNLDAAYLYRGIAYSALGQYKRAIEDFNGVIRLKPDCAEVYLSRGMAYSALGQKQRAIKDYNVAIRLDPDFARAYVHRGLAYIITGDGYGCLDVKKACELGHCEGYDLVKKKGICP